MTGALQRRSVVAQIVDQLKDEGYQLLSRQQWPQTGMYQPTALLKGADRLLWLDVRPTAEAGVNGDRDLAGISHQAAEIGADQFFILY